MGSTFDELTNRHLGVDADEVLEVSSMGDDDLDALIKDLVTNGADQGDWDVLCAPLAVARTKPALARVRTFYDQRLPRAKRPDNRLWQEIMRRTREVDTASRLAYEAQREREKSEHRAVLRQLAVAVERHRLACVDADLGAEPYDLALWDLLDQLDIADRDNRRTLGDMVRSGSWS